LVGYSKKYENRIFHNRNLKRYRPGVYTQLLKKGDIVPAGARRPEDSPELMKLKSRYTENLHLFKLDVTKENMIREIAKKIPVERIDVFINNAGVLDRDNSFGSLNFEEILRIIDTNTLGPLRMAQALLPYLSRSSQPKIVNVSSIMGSISDTFGGGFSYGYKISKAALNMVTRMLAGDLHGYGIIVVSVHPGWVRTDMGGPGAPVTPEESVRGLLRVIENLKMEDSGSFIEYTGNKLNW